MNAGSMHEFNQEARAEHEKFIQDLANMIPGSSVSLESTIARADEAYSLAYDFGLFRSEQAILSGEQNDIVPFVSPSFKREYLYQEDVKKDRPPLIGSYFLVAGSALKPLQEYRTAYIDSLDPKIALANFEGPIAIREIIDDNDPVLGSSTLNWLGCSSIEAATKYCERVGWYHNQPRSVEENGVHTVREIYDNPYYLEKVNASLGEVDPELVLAAIREAVAVVGLSPEDPFIESTINAIVLNVVQSNIAAKQQLMNSGDTNKVRGYLNPKVRLNVLTSGKYKIESYTYEVIDNLRIAMGIDLPMHLSAEDLLFIDKVASSLVDSLQVPYELQVPTHGEIASILQGLSVIARLKKQSIQALMQIGMEKKAQESSAWVDDYVVSFVKSINKGYSGTMKSYADADHVQS